MAHTLTLDPTSVTLTPGGAPQTVVATIAGVAADTTVTDVAQAVVGSVTAFANLTVTVDNPNPLVSVPTPSPGVNYLVGSPVQDPADPTVWTCEISVSA